jgi:hypothetical protein
VADPTSRSAARLATLVALPIAVLAGLLSLWKFGAFDGPAAPAPTPTAPATGPVSLPAPSLAAQPAAVCRGVIAHLPAEVNGAARRPVSAGTDQNAAYGEPPITLACGAVQPAVAPLDAVYPLSGVCFVPVSGPSSTVWTTVDRQVPVAVTVPGPAAGSAQSVIPFAAAIDAGDPPKTDVPAGCTNYATPTT